MQLDYFLLCLQSDHSSFPLSDSCAKDIFYLSGSVFKCDGGSILDYHIQTYALDRKQSSVDCRKKSLKCLLKAWGNTPIKKITTPVYTKFRSEEHTSELQSRFE